MLSKPDQSSAMRRSRRWLSVIPHCRTWRPRVEPVSTQRLATRWSSATLADDFECEIVEQRPIQRCRLAHPLDPVVFGIGEVIGEVFGVTGRRQFHVAARADLLKRGARDLPICRRGGHASRHAETG
jgi:hypothetical protein